MTKRERERQHFAQEGRLLFGDRARVEGVDHDGYDPRLAAREQSRLNAVHDPGQPSACRLCGRTVAPTSEAVAGWKVCALCTPLLRGGLPAVWGDVLAPLPVPVTWPEAEALGNPCTFATGWPTDPGQPERWAHVDVEAKREQLTGLRGRGTTPRPNPSHTGCRWCGVSRSLTWTEAGQWGRGRKDPKAYICAECAPRWLRGGRGPSWRNHLLACIVDSRPTMDVNYGVKAYWEVADDDHAGTATRWAYLGDVRTKLRARMVREHPRLLHHVTAHERRILKIETEVAQAEQAPERQRLADV